MEQGKEVVKIKLDQIIPNRFQPRIAFDEQALEELSSSIKTHGILQPLILRPLGDKYEIIAGERRYKAATKVGLTEVPAIIVNLDDQTSAELAIIENIQRKDLTPIEEAKAYKKLIDLGNLTQDQLAAKMGKNQSTIANKLRLLNLVPEAQDALLNNEISERHARSLLQIKDDPEKQKEVLNKIVKDRLTVKDTDEYIKSLNNTTVNNQTVSAPIYNNDNILNINTPLPTLSESITTPVTPVTPVTEPTIAPVTPTVESSNENVITPVIPIGPEPTAPSSTTASPQAEIPAVEPVLPNISVSSEPVVQSQPENKDSVSIDALNTPLIPVTPVNENITSALSDLNLVNTASDIFNDTEPQIEDKNDQTQMIDIDAIKAAASEPPKPTIPDFDSLLKVEEPKVEEVVEEEPPVKPVGTPTPTNRFFNSLEDEVANVSFSSAFPTMTQETNNEMKQDTNPFNISSSANEETVKLPDAINNARELVDNFNKNGLHSQIEEMDLPDKYQITITIDKM